MGKDGFENKVHDQKPSFPELLFGPLGKKGFNQFSGEDSVDEKLGKHLTELYIGLQSKYSLPTRELREKDTARFIEEVYKRMDEIGVAVRDYRDDPNLDKLRSHSCAYQDSTKTIWIDLDFQKNDVWGFSGDLAHEATHAEQYREMPEMTIEQKELEATLRNNINPDNLNREGVQAILVDSVKSSALFYRTNMGMEIPWEM